MSIAAQKLLAVFFFAIFMAVGVSAWSYVVHNWMPQWALDAFFFVGLPVWSVCVAVMLYRHRKAGGHLRKRRDDYGFDD